MKDKVEILELPSKDGEALEARVLGILTEEAAKVGVVFTPRDVLLEARVGGVVAGGLSAKLGRAWLVVELIALAPEFRGVGLGAALMARAEEITRASGAGGIWLDTFTFQAPGFYERLGFVEFGRIADYVNGHDRVFYEKRLAAGGESDG